MTGAFLLEIGTEEIPAGFIPKALEGLQSLLAKKLAELQLPYREIRTMGTPRRLACSVDGLLLRQEDEEKTVFGPPKQAAFDADGNPTKAAAGFARAHGADPSDLSTENTAKGEVVCLRKKIEGRNTAELLSEFLPGLITSLPFPKSMRWGSSTISFARPIHWILAILEGKVVPFEVGSISSSDMTRGHRFAAPEPFAVKNEADYREKLRKAYVIVDPSERSAMLREEITKSVVEAGGTILPDDELVEENTYLVEYPAAACGGFDQKYLELPRQVLITAMREHQRYFAVTDKNGDLLPHFVAVNNTPARNPGVVRSGHERVLRARLEDARFFYEEDSKASLADHAERLRNVLFQAKLGTSYEKMERFRELAAFMAGRIKPESAEDVKRCAYLCKADLVSEMVGEFPSLQGVMGAVYAKLAGEDLSVASGIEEHYLPRFSGDRLPEGDVGAMVGIADRLDTITGCFSIGLIPTGAADPYALRRHTLAIIHILLDKQYDLDLRELVQESLRLLGERIERPEADILQDVLDFFRVRLRGVLLDRGFGHDVLDSVLSLYGPNIPDAVKRVEAVSEWRNRSDFETSATSFKRVFNIIKDQPVMGDVDSGLFQTHEEAQLLGGCQTVGKDVEPAMKDKDYRRALSSMLSLKGPIDAFFDSVMVMDKDPQVRANRLNLLGNLTGLFCRLADFSKLEV